MSLLTSIQNMNSGLNTSQVGLQVTSNNLTNINTQGYTRQIAIQQDNAYIKVGNYKTGTGVSISEIRQIRDEMLDKRFRTENATYTYYSTKSSVLSNMESIIGTDGETTLDVLNTDIWNKLQQLSNSPSGESERISFIKSCENLLNKVGQIQDDLSSYQSDINRELQSGIKTVNQLLTTIKELNESIAKDEISGTMANEKRDLRNNALDELSQYLEISYKEDSTGRIAVQSRGTQLVDGPFVFELDESKLDGNTSNTGSLKALMEAKETILPELQQKVERYVTEIVTTINEAFSTGRGQGDYADVVGTPVFVTVEGQVVVNPLLLETGGHQALGTSVSGDAEDSTLVKQLLEDWNEAREWEGETKQMTFGEYYSSLVLDLASETSHQASKASESYMMASSIDNERLSLSGVSQDEELSNLLKYQHAYSAAARMVSVMDQMLEQIIQGL